MVSGNYHEVDSLESKKADVFARVWQWVGSGGGSAGEDRGREVSRSIVLLIGGEVAMYICKESVP